MMILTEGFELVKANGALAMGRLDAARVENMIAFEEPDFLLVPHEVKAQLAIVTPV